MNTVQLVHVIPEVQSLPRRKRRPQHLQVSTVARRGLQDVVILAGRLMGSRAGLTPDNVGDAIIDGIADLKGADLHVLWVVYKALRHVSTHR
jgi:hypothetical protein